MSYNGSGTFLINSTGQPVVANTVISATVFNALTADLATGLSTAITKDGQTTITANIPFGNNKITGLAAGTAATDSANLGQVQSTAAKLITVTGTDTITGSMSPALTAYAAGQLFYFVAAGANTGAVTINIDGLGAKSVTRDGSVALAGGDINSGEVVVLVYDGTRFQMINAANSFGNTTINGTLTVTGNTGLQANVSITSALSVGGTFNVTGAAVLGSTLSVTGKSDLPTVSTASMNAAVALITTGTVTNLTATGASIASANIGNLQFTAASIASINAGVAVITNLTATGASIASANVGTAVITTGTVTNLTSTSASVASANAAVALVTTGTVTNLTSTSASIASANVGTAVVTGLTVTGASIASVNVGAAVLSGNLTLNGGTANGVLYLNGSKVATSGSALTFDGTNLGIGTASPTANLEVGGSGNKTLRVGTTSNSYAYLNLNTWALDRAQLRAEAANPSAGSGTGAGKLTIWTANSGSLVERMAIDGDGNVGIGGTASAAAKLNVKGTLPQSGGFAFGIYSDGVVSSATTNNARILYTLPSTEAASFTCGGLSHFHAAQGTFGAGSTVTNQFGFLADSSLTGATNNYGFYSDIASGSNRWNFYANGTAANYFAGSTGVGLAPDTNYAFTAYKSTYGVLVKTDTAANECTSQWNTATSGDNKFEVFYTDNAVARGSIDYNRAGGLVAYNITSDYRAKDVYGAWDDAGATIDALKVYRGKMHGATLERPMMIAHEAQAVVPYAVGGEKDAVNKDGTPKYQTMDHQILVPLLIAELQAVRARLAALEAK